LGLSWRRRKKGEGTFIHASFAKTGGKEKGSCRNERHAWARYTMLCLAFETRKEKGKKRVIKRSVHDSTSGFLERNMPISEQGGGERAPLLNREEGKKKRGEKKQVNASGRSAALDARQSGEQERGGGRGARFFSKREGRRGGEFFYRRDD